MFARTVSVHLKLKTFARMIDGTPKVQTFEAITSTFHKVAVAV